LERQHKEGMGLKEQVKPCSSLKLTGLTIRSIKVIYGSVSVGSRQKKSTTLDILFAQNPIF